MATAPAAPDAVLRALRSGGVATLDALAARLGGPDRDSLAWTLEELDAEGLVHLSRAADCGPDGLCGTQAPTTVRITDQGAARA
jgi:hypothetical protein